MPQYQYRLGRKQDVTDLVTDGGFAAACGVNWTCGANWGIAAGVATRAIGSPGTFLTQASVFELGKRYRVLFDVNTLTSSSGAFIGDYGSSLATLGANTIEHVCLLGTSLQFWSQGTFTIDNVQAFEMIFNDPLTDEPLGFEGSEITIERDRVLNGIFREYTTELTFVGDGYDFILAEFTANGFCSEIPVLIEEKCSDSDDFDTFFEGVIYLSDCEFDLRKCQVKATVEDRGAGQILRNNREVDVGFDPINLSFGVVNFLVQPDVVIDFHDSTGAYPPGAPYTDLTIGGLSLNVEETFRRIIHDISDVNIDFESTFFSAGTFADLIVKFGADLRSDILPDFDHAEKKVISFMRLFDIMNSIFDLEVQVYYPSGVPTIKIEQKIDFLTAPSVLTVSNVAEPTFTFDISQFFKTITIGYKEEFESDDGTRQYISLDPCSQQELNIVAEAIADSDIIFEQLAGEEMENSARNGNFDDTSEWTLTGNWAIAGGTANDAAGTGGQVTQGGVTDTDCEFDSTTGGECRYEVVFTISGRTAGTVTPNLGGNAGTARAANGTFTEIINSDSVDDRLRFVSNTAFDGSIDGVTLRKFKAKDKYDEDLFVVETDGAQTSQFGGGNAYNGNIEVTDNITRWVETLQNSVVKLRDTTETITKTNNPLIRVWAFEAPLSKSEWDLILMDDSVITFNSPENGVTNTEGHILRLTRNSNTGMAQFRLLTE